MLLKYYLPLCYTLNTRYTNIINKISFFIITFIPGFIINILYTDFRLEQLIHFFLAFCAMYSIYECGYIFNDIVTVRFEKTPTQRFPKDMNDNLLQHLQNLLTVRCVIAFLCVSYFSFVGYDVIYFSFLLIILEISYTIHNFFRNRINILTMALIVHLKYLIPVLLFINKSIFLKVNLVIFFSISLIRTIEYASKDRYALYYLKIDNYEYFRVKYYLMISLAMYGIYILGNLKQYDVILPLYLLMFRWFSAFIMKYSCISAKIEKNRKHNNN